MNTVMWGSDGNQKNADHKFKSINNWIKNLLGKF